MGPRSRGSFCAGGGAFVNFEGVARNNTKGRATLSRIRYEAMAVKMMSEIGQIARSHSIGRIAMVHRLDRLEISETRLAVVVTAPSQAGV
jgi:molybdopterin synthase catalytic subunit